MPGTGGVALGQAFERLGDRLRLARQVDDQRPAADHGDLARQDRGRHEAPGRCAASARRSRASPWSATASVASGVTSRGAGPVPPVVSTRSQPASSTSSHSVALDRRLLVGDQARLPVDRVAAARARASRAAPECPCPRRRRLEARSLTETRPMRTRSCAAASASGASVSSSCSCSRMNWNSSR